MEEASIEGVHPSKRGSNGVGGVCVCGYSNLITPMTKATACMAEYGNSKGSYFSLSDTMRTWSLSLPGFIRLMSAPWFVSIT